MKMFIPRNTILICTLQMDMVLIAFHFQKKKKKPMEVVGKNITKNTSLHTWFLNTLAYSWEHQLCLPSTSAVKTEA